MQTHAVTFEPTSFRDVPGWSEDNHLAAWKAFLASCDPVLKIADQNRKSNTFKSQEALFRVCARALDAAKDKSIRTSQDARRFFETNFRPHRVTGTKTNGLLTGYYEPVLQGSRTPTPAFKIPIYRRPPDLVNLVAESERGAKSASATHMRQTAHGLRPYLTRAEIEQGGLAGQGLELMYFKDPVDVFFMQVQGSGRVQLPDGERVRIAYDGKNGYPYTSIGRALIDQGEISARAMSLNALKQWLRKNRERAKAVMWKNESYVFFRELTGATAHGPIGANNVPLQPGRSLAVDTSYYALGTPIFVDAPAITHATKSGTFRRLMIAQDVGSAIKGPERGDIYFGSGDKAGRLAGVTKEPGHFIVLLPTEGASGDVVTVGSAP
ncbi:murein transglycosylase A [Hyphomicrobium sp.]|jgi:membrane-bound lytic murein transglycosylase A|uniref:murein transglycosylase A n=1 Tax=Hyphomicrobium sp. TaxID=82 RepID=UPI002B7722EE|nr:MltA domain-containing protein [Hyphomicrobium sp.]HVZ04915.1 MltA domain-containing protein [Hyphomicrobium sp.]